MVTIPKDSNVNVGDLVWLEKSSEENEIKE